MQNKATKLTLSLLVGAIISSGVVSAAELPFVPVGQGGATFSLPSPVSLGKQTAPSQQKPKKAAPRKSNNNPYEIDDSAVDLKGKQGTRFELPKLGATGGKAPVINQNVVRIVGNDNQPIYVSFKMPNRISTPFTKPAVVDMTGTNFQVFGQDVYVTPEKGGPIGVFIREEDGNGPVASLTLVPANIPGQNISLTFDGSAISPEKDAFKSGVEGRAQAGFIDEVRETLSAVVNNQIPEGFTSAPMRVGTARVGNLLATPVRMMGGVDRDVFIYALENIGSSRVEMTEQSFYREGVLGVTFWPLVKLDPGARSHVFILAQKLEAR